MLVVLTETYCNKVNIQITQRDDFIQTYSMVSHAEDVILVVNFWLYFTW